MVRPPVAFLPLYDRGIDHARLGTGVFVYTYQGQFTLGLAYTGVSKYSWQTVGNSIALVTGIIAVRHLPPRFE